MAEQRPDRPNRKPGRPGGPGGSGGNGSFRFRSGLFGWLLFIALAVLLVMLVQRSGQHQAEIANSDFWRFLKTDKIQEMKVEGDEISGKFREKQRITQIANGGPTETLEFKTAFPTGSMAQS